MMLESGGGIRTFSQEGLLSYQVVLIGEIKSVDNEYHDDTASLWFISWGFPLGVKKGVVGSLWGVSN